MNKRYSFLVMAAVILSGCASVPRHPDSGMAQKKTHASGSVSVNELNQKKKSGYRFILIDVRRASSFHEIHIEGAISVPLAEIEYKKFPAGMELIVYCESSACSSSKKAADILARKGYGKVDVLKGGLKEWESAGFPVVAVWRKSSPGIVPAISARELEGLIASGDPINLADIRSPAEFGAGHIEGAVNIPAGAMKQDLEKLDKNILTVFYSRAGNRCSNAANMALSAGIKDVRILSGGMLVWEKRGYRVTAK